MTLKIIAGRYGSRVLRTVRGLGTRPLLGQVREAIFNILGDAVPGAVVWDLFAGTGANGIEALSRDAHRVLFVEKNGRACDVLRQNLRSLGPEAIARSVVVRADAWDPPVLRAADYGGDEAAPPAEAADADAEVAPAIVFLDPPYALVAEDPVKSVFRARALLKRAAPGGCVVFHFEEGQLDEDDFDDDLEVDLRTWGSTAIAFVWRLGEAPEHIRRRRQRANRGEPG